MSGTFVNVTATSLSQGRTTTAPGANTALVTVALEAGAYYDVEVLIGFGATAEATTADNFQLLFGGVAVTDKLSSPVAVNGWVNSPFRCRVFAAAAGNLTVNNITAGSAGAIYRAQLTATRIL
jgi:hypothetical protein